MTVRFNVNGVGFVGAEIGATLAGLVGYYGADGKPYGPDAAAIRALLPHRWRAAFDREPGGFWFSADAPAYRHLYSSRGRHLTTVYAHAFEVASEVEPEYPEPGDVVTLADIGRTIVTDIDWSRGQDFEPRVIVEYEQDGVTFGTRREMVSLRFAGFDADGATWTEQ